MTEHVIEENGTVQVAETEVFSFADSALAQLAHESERRVEAMNMIKRAALKLTNARDWVAQGDNPYLCASGAEKIAAVGVSVRDVTRQKFVEDDENGRYYVWEYSGTFTIAGRSIEAIGTCSSRDEFFAKRGGELIPVADVDQTNIMKAAYSNLLVNGISRLLGLRSLTWDDLQTAQIRQSECQSVVYGKGSKGGSTADEKEMRKEIAEKLMEMAGGEKDEASQMLYDLTTFTGKDGETVEGVKETGKLRGKRLQVTLGKVRDHYKTYQQAANGELPLDDK